MRNVPDRDLVRYYQQARVFVFPSRYEGFGMPLLESAACGTPVIANASAGMVQVGGDAVLYFSGPDEASSLSAQLEKMCFDDDLHREYTLKGLEQAAKFSWDKFVHQFNEFICSLE
jgi:glycosyltransferase involved in cell wall biosynthesis